MVFPFPAINRELGAVWVGRGVQVHMRCHLGLWGCEPLIVVFLTRWGRVWDERLVDFRRLAQALWDIVKMARCKRGMEGHLRRKDVL